MGVGSIVVVVVLRGRKARIPAPSPKQMTMSPSQPPTTGIEVRATTMMRPMIRAPHLRAAESSETASLTPFRPKRERRTQP